MKIVRNAISLHAASHHLMQTSEIKVIAECSPLIYTITKNVCLVNYAQREKENDMARIQRVQPLVYKALVDHPETRTDDFILVLEVLKNFATAEMRLAAEQDYRDYALNN